MPSFVTCGPNEAIIVSGCCHSNPTIRAGGRVFVWAPFHRVQRISLNNMTLNVESTKVYSLEGVPVTVKGVAQVKIQGNNLDLLRSASEMFLDKREDEIMDIAKATVDGHQRSIIAAKPIEKIYKERKEFSECVQKSAQTDLCEMGLTLVSYTVQNISDDEGYLDALGQVQTVNVKSEARKKVAVYKSETETKNLEVELEKKKKEIDYEQSLALKRLDFEQAQAQYLRAHFENQARSEKAGDLKVAEINLNIVKEELNVLHLEKKKETELMVQRKELKGLELIDQVQKKAEFECDREIRLSEANLAKKKAEADAEAAKLLRLGEARAEVVRQEREAEAQVLRDRAEAFAQYGDAAKLEMVLAILPRLTAEIAGPITNCKKITSVSQDGSAGPSRITADVVVITQQLIESVGINTGQLGQSNSSTRGNNNNSDNDDQNSSTTRRRVSSKAYGEGC